MDWTAFVLSFKGVLLEGLEIALIVISFGATANAFPTAILGAAAALPVAWPGGEGAILALVGWYVLAATGYIGLLRRHAGRLVPLKAR